MADSARVTPLRAADLWSHQPTGIMAYGREFGIGGEQVVALENRTATRGENVIVMRAHYEDGPRIDPFSIDTVFEQVGGPPAPFENAKPGDLIMGEDAVGPLFWITKRVGGDTLCVLAMRRLSNDRNLTPPGVSALDVLLRNCVIGDVEQAIAPFRPDRIATAAVANNEGGADAARYGNISPLAAPSPGGVAPAFASARAAP